MSFRSANWKQLTSLQRMRASDVVSVLIAGLTVLPILGASGVIMGGYDTVRWVLLVVASVVVLTGLQNVRLPVGSVLIGGVLFLGGGVASFLLSDPSSAKFAELFLYLLYFGAIWVFASNYFASTKQVWRRHVDVLLISAAVGVTVYAILSLLTYTWFIRDGGGLLHDHLPFGFPHRRFWSHLATWCLPLIPALLVWFSRRGGSPFTMWCLRLGAGVWCWILILSMARGSLVSISAAALFVGLAMGQTGRFILGETIRLLAIGIAMWLVLSHLVPETLFELDADGRRFHTTSSGRMGLWAEALRLSLSQFPLGVGALGWPIDQSSVGHPHNMLLLWAAEWGWLGVFGIMAIVIASARRWWALRLQLINGPVDDGLRFAALTSSVTAASIHAQVSGVFIMPWSMLVGLSILALFFAIVWRRDYDEAGPVQRSRWSQRTLMCLVALSIGGGMYAVANYHSQMTEYNRIDEAKRKKPRFWIDGRVPFRGAEPQSADGS